ncbi:MAG: hypothetical protein ACJ77F_09845 [Chloroflexota bacterium]
MSSAWYRPAIAVGVAIASVLISLLVVQPFVDAPVGFDTQATVAYFDRLASGSRLEEALTTTPKPFLTIVYGLLHGLSNDWRPIVWATILALGAGAGLAAVLAARAAGNVSGVLVGVAVASTPLLVEDAAYANAVPWALLGWAIAGVMLAADRPRPIAAGLVLALAALCRLETLVLVVIGAAALAWARFGPWPARFGPRPAPPSRAWLTVVIPFAALPVMLVHDYLLTGNPLFWLDVSRRYSDAVRGQSEVAGPVERVVWFARRFRPLWPLALAAALGILVLVRRHAWLMLVGLAGMGPGIAAFLVLLAARGLFAPERYALPVDIAVAASAAITAGSLVDLAADAVGRRRAGADAPSRIAAAVMVPVAALGCLAILGAGPFDTGTVQAIADARAVSGDLVKALPALRPEGDAAPAPGVRWFVPGSVRPRTAVDLGVPLTSLRRLPADLLEPGAASLTSGQRIFFDRRAALPPGVARLGDGAPIAVGPLDLEPILSDPANGYWVYEVRPSTRSP